MLSSNAVLLGIVIREIFVTSDSFWICALRLWKQDPHHHVLSIPCFKAQHMGLSQTIASHLRQEWLEGSILHSAQIFNNLSVIDDGDNAIVTLTAGNQHKERHAGQAFLRCPDACCFKVHHSSDCYYSNCH